MNQEVAVEKHLSEAELEGLFWFNLDVDGFDSLFSGHLDEASVGGEEDVGPRVAIEADVLLSVAAGGDEGEGGAGAGADAEGAGVHSRGVEGPAEELAEGVVADLADEPGADAEAGEADRYVGRGAAGCAGKGGEIGEGDVLVDGDEVYQQLTEGDGLGHGGTSRAGLRNAAAGRASRPAGLFRPRGRFLPKGVVLLLWE